MSDEIERKVLETISKEFGVPVTDLNRGTVADDVDGWDSIRHISLILQLEANFGIEFDTVEVAGVENVGDLIDLIAK